MRDRHKARELVLQILYQTDIGGISAEKALKIILSRYHFKPGVKKFSKVLIRGTHQFLLPINSLIERYAKNWTLERMAVVDRNILRLATYELLFLEEVPPVVSINEAVEIAKRYGTKDSGKFVNGILDKIHRERGRGSPLGWIHLKDVLRKNSYLEKLVEVKEKSKLWLVGGYLRDNLLNKESRDLDLIIEDPGFKVAQRFAQEMNANLFALSSTSKRSTFPNGVIVDFNLKRSSSLNEDLLQRDFTIDALALDLDSLEAPSLMLVDPNSGLENLINKKIKLMGEKALEEDPLRMLRALRLASQLSFTIEEEITSFVQKNSSLIRKTSKERVRDELFLLLKKSSSCKYLKDPSVKTLLKEVFNRVPNIENLKRMEKILSNEKIIPAKLREKIISHLRSKEGGTRSRGELLKLVALIFSPHGEGYNLSLLGRNLKLRKKEINIIKRIEKTYPELRKFEEDQEDLEFIAHFFLEVREETIETVLLFLTENLDRKEASKVALFLLEKYFQKFPLIHHPPELINGKDLMKSLGINAGPEVSYLLNKIHQAQIMEEVKTREEALRYARQALTRIPPGSSKSPSEVNIQ